MLGEAHLDGDVQGHGVLFLREKLHDGDGVLDGLIRAVDRTGQGHGREGRAVGGLVLLSIA